MIRGRRALFALLVALLVVACGGGSAATTTFAGIVREPAPDVSNVSLPEASRGGAPMQFRAEPRGLLVVYFGYLSCPDVCPTTMADLRTTLDAMRPADRSKIDVVMTTIDPGRDTADALTAYVHAFIPEGRAARSGDEAQLRAAAAAFGADYRVTATSSGTVEVSHTAFVYLVDDRGHIRLTWPFGMKSPDMRRDLTRLLTLVADEA